MWCLFHEKWRTHWKCQKRSCVRHSFWERRVLFKMGIQSYLTDTGIGIWTCTVTTVIIWGRGHHVWCIVLMQSRRITLRPCWTVLWLFESRQVMNQTRQATWKEKTIWERQFWKLFNRFIPRRRWVFKESVSTCKADSKSCDKRGRNWENKTVDELRSLKHPANSLTDNN